MSRWFAKGRDIPRYGARLRESTLSNNLFDILDSRTRLYVGGLSRPIDDSARTRDFRAVWHFPVFGGQFSLKAMTQPFLWPHRAGEYRGPAHQVSARRL